MMLYLNTLSITTRLLIMCLSIGYILSIQEIDGISYFETVDLVHRQSRIKRSMYGEIIDTQDYVKFQAFNRSFEFLLNRGTNVLAKGFQAEAMQADGRAERFHVDVNQIFTGHLLDDTDVKANGHMEDSMISLTIYDYEDIYIIEPASMYSTSQEKSWVVYRYSDTSFRPGMGMGVDPFNLGDNLHCGSGTDMVPSTDDKDFNQTSDYGNGDDYKEDIYVRKPKRAIRRNTCGVLMVVTYNYFVLRCHKSYYICCNVVISLVMFVNNVFSSTDLEPFEVNVQIEKIKLFTSPTKVNNSYNSDLNKIWNDDNLLSAFRNSFSPYFEVYCIKFLLNVHRIADNVMGLAHVGSLCSRAQNTGFASAMVSDRLIPSIQLKILLVHEMGHLFGSHHDPMTDECYQPINRGGNYIMWPIVYQMFCPNCVV